MSRTPTATAQAGGAQAPGCSSRTTSPPHVRCSPASRPTRTRALASGPSTTSRWPTRSCPTTTSASWVVTRSCATATSWGPRRTWRPSTGRWWAPASITTRWASTAPVCQLPAGGVALRRCARLDRRAHQHAAGDQWRQLRQRRPLAAHAGLARGPRLGHAARPRRFGNWDWTSVHGRQRQPADAHRWLHRRCAHEGLRLSAGWRLHVRAGARPLRCDRRPGPDAGGAR